MLFLPKRSFRCADPCFSHIPALTRLRQSDLRGIPDTTYVYKPSGHWSKNPSTCSFKKCYNQRKNFEAPKQNSFMLLEWLVLGCNEELCDLRQWMHRALPF